MSQDVSDAITTNEGLALGRWRADRDRSRVGFEVKTLWGLVNVKGSFARFEGALNVRHDGISASLSIEADSLDTGNARRDEHLRSPDYFDVEHHPAVEFTASEITRSADGTLLVVGGLQVRDRTVRLQLPVTAVPGAAGRLRLRGRTTVTREQVGMTWNRAGMIKDPAHLVVEVELVPAEAAARQAG
ncbi:YceI family protein [Conexibacter sp. CPCC 206217]|uniref:YceI family protein n=1 Tax=Conexibacter sp. CPCC 206217 TaxID=3064574 RepID=UPI002718BD69|nr:YceI family protein [Conexibacter sp. CPCC 206217]MDO8212384.1 YceI family protein [Conexibacter sp. CPCC 206217]